MSSHVSSYLPWAMKYTRRLLQCCLVTLALSSPALAEPVSVNRGIGLGYVFTHNQNCFLILPAHVHGRGSRVSISTTIPTTVGDATLVRSFAPELDLSLFYVTSGLENRCSDRFSALPEEIGTLLDNTATAQLIRVDATGAETRDAMTITASDFETLNATAVSTEIYQGTSGAILRIGTTPIGMAIQSESTDQATFLRMDEIAARIRRVVTPAQVQIVEQDAPQSDTAQCPAGAIRIATLSCTMEPIAPEYACSNLMADGGGMAAFPPGSTPRVEITLDVPQAEPLRSVELLSQPGEGFAVPQQITVETSSTRGAPRWLRFGGRDMPPTGKVDIVNGAAPFANRVAIEIHSTWAADLPPALSCITLK